MGGVVDSVTDTLFGSSGEPGRVVDTTPQAFGELRRPTSDALRNILSGGGQQAFSGQMTAPVTGTEQQLLDQIMGQSQPSGAAQQSMQTLEQAAAGQGLSPDSNPFLAATIQSAQRPLIEQFNDETLPGLRAQFAQAGQQIQGEGSSPFQMAQARASSGLANALGDVSTELSGQNFQQERQRQLQAATAIPEVERAQLDQSMRALEAQALPRLVEQFGIDRGLEEFRRRQETLMQAIQLAGGLAQAQPQALQGTQPTGGLLGGFAQGFGAGVGGGLTGG